MLQTDLCPIDVLGISETFLMENDPSNQLLIDVYHKPERNDRKGKEGGGVLAYISEALDYNRRDDLETLNAEIMWLEITPHKAKHFLVGFVYREPKTKAATDQVIEQNIEDLLGIGLDIYVLGDVNVDLLKHTDFPLYKTLKSLDLIS